MKTGIITTESYLNHETGPGHPERADRVSVIVKNLKKFEKKLVWKKPITVDKNFLKHGELFSILLLDLLFWSPVLLTPLLHR